MEPETIYVPQDEEQKWNALCVTALANFYLAKPVQVCKTQQEPSVGCWEEEAEDVSSKD